MGNLDMSWNSMKAFIGQRTFKEEIMNFDARKVSKATRDAVQRLLVEKGESFEESVIKRSSVAAAPLALWVKANLQYANVMETVLPMETELRVLTAKLKTSKARVSDLQSALDNLDRDIDCLREEFALKTKETCMVKDALTNVLDEISSSQSLLMKLSGEEQRWQLQVDELVILICELPQTALLAAAFQTYLGRYDDIVRFQMVQKWLLILKVSYDTFDFTLFMSSDLAPKHIPGLADDSISKENSIMIENTIGVVPLIIDPTGSALKWLEGYLANSKPDIICHGDASFLRSLEHAVRFGKTLIVKEIFHFDIYLISVIRKELENQGTRLNIAIGEKSVDYNDSFRLYLVTSNANIAPPPEIQGFINEINYSTSQTGLYESLLALTVQNENPQLEEKKRNLINNENSMKKELKSLETALLKELATSQGNILQNKSLVKSLEETKVKSLIIAKSLSESLNLNATLEIERQKYHSIAVLASELYLILRDLKMINPMYQFSLPYFMKVFQRALNSQIVASEVNLRVANFKTMLEKIVFDQISRSMKVADIHILALSMIHVTHRHLFGQNEWDLFCGRHDVAVIFGQDKSYEWVPAERKVQFLAFCVFRF